MLVMPVSDLWGLQKGQAVPDCNLCSALGEMASGGLLVIFTYEIIKDKTTQGYDDSFSLSNLQVVPDCESRSALGETADGGLLDIFTRDFGPPGCPTFEAARHNFLRSEAGCDSCRSHMSLYSLVFLCRKIACRDIELQLAIG